MSKRKILKLNRIYIDTLGCAKNEYESQMLASELEKRGCEMVPSPDLAEIMIVNTCGFIDDAKKESIERIFELSEYHDKKLIVTGCLSQRYHDELVKEMPEVDMFFGVNDYERIPAIILDDNSEVTDGTTDNEDALPYRTRILPEGAHSGVLKIAEGCNNACSFCAIPAIRGRFRSKKIEDCVHEAQDMADAGISEIILIAQDTSQYGIDLYGKIMLPELIKKLAAIDGIHWIRLMYVYDNGITDELIDVMLNEPKVCKYIDIPIQHISDNVLRRMRRRSTGASIRECITKLRSRIPDIHIRTTLLVGFPGETEEDFAELIDFIDEFKFDRLGAFAFSDEEGTASFEMDGKLDEDIKRARQEIVMQHQQAVSEELNENTVGKVYEVLIEEDCGNGLYVGRTQFDAPEIDCDVIVQSDRDIELGEYINVKIINAYEYDLEGEEV